MKIAIATTLVPFVYGGAEFLIDELVKQLKKYGHEPQALQLPFSWHPKSHLTDQMLAARLMQIDDADMVIAMKFPAYYIKHDNKRMWLIHQFRQAYDFVGTEFAYFDNSVKDQKIQKAIIQADNQYLPEHKGPFYTISPVVSERLKKYNDIDSVPMCSPLIDEEIYHEGEYGDYIFYPSRVNQSKRQYLAIEALRYTKSKVRLILAGKGDTPQDEKYILEQIEKYQLKNRVTYLNSFISQEEKADLYSKALGSVYIPFDEDSYGYVTLEAMHSKKPVISCTDAGGTYLVVKDNLTGYMTQPNAHAIAEAMDKLYYNRNKAKEMGNNGLPLLDTLGITWESTIRRLTE